MLLFKERTTCPDARDPAYCAVSGGGKNHSILGNPKGRIYEFSVLPNCTGHVHGRCIEQLGTDAMLCRGNAENYWDYHDNLRRSQTPMVGSIACWRKGNAHHGDDGAGHVAFVEAVNSVGDITVSESGWTGTKANGRYWRRRTIRRKNGTYSIGSAYTFQGFIHVYDPVRINPVKDGVYRLYNPNGNEHMFTLNHGEANSLVRAGWRYEGIGWYAPTEGSNVYRLYNRRDHLLTTNAQERDKLVALGWKYEGIAMHSGGDVEVYRLYNANSGEHMYTADYKERDALIRMGWRYECIALRGEKK